MLGTYIDDALLSALRETLQHLENLRLIDPRDVQILRLKRAFREKIREIEERTELIRAA